MRILNTEIGRQVDEAFRQAFKLGQTRHHMPVRQTEEQHIAGLQFFDGDKLVFANLAQVGVQAGDQLAGVALGSNLLYLHLGMKQ